MTKLSGFVAQTVSLLCRGLFIRDARGPLPTGRVPLGGAAGWQPALALTSFRIVWLLLSTVALTAGSALGQEAQRAGQKEFSAFKVIVDRNIFDPNRRPHVASGPAPTIVDWFALTGTLSYDKGTFAVFDGSGSDYHKVLESGGKIAGYTLARIQRDSAELSAGSNHVELRVGMQMRRSEDGTWEPAEAAVASISSGSGRSERGHNGFSAAHLRPREGGAHATPSTPPEQPEAGGPPPPETAAADNPDSATLAPPPDGANSGNPDDPVARMMRRRLQETGGSENNTPNQ